MCLILSKNTLANIFSYSKLGTVGLRRRNRPKVQQLQFINHLTENVCMYITYSCFLTPIGGRLLIPYATKFSLAKIFAKGLYYVLGQKFCQSHELPSRKLWVELVSCSAHMYARANVLKFSLCKKITEKIFANSMHWHKFSHGENFCVYYYTVCFPPPRLFPYRLCFPPRLFHANNFILIVSSDICSYVATANFAKIVIIMTVQNL